MNEDPRVVLGVERGATAADIRAAYRRAVKVAHPDMGGSNEAFARVRAAFEALIAAPELETAAPAAPRPGREAEDLVSHEGHWMTVRLELTHAWELSGEPAIAFPPRKIGLSPFVVGERLNASAYAWLVQHIGPRGERWEFNVTDDVPRLFFRTIDEARRFRLKFA